MMSAWQPPRGVEDGARTAAGAAAGEDGDAVSGLRGGGDGRRRKSWTRIAEEKKQKKQQARRLSEDAILEQPRARGRRAQSFACLRRRWKRAEAAAVATPAQSAYLAI